MAVRRMFRCQNFISRCSHQCHVLACAGTQPDQTLYPDGAVCLTTSQSAVRVLLALQSSNCAESGCLRRTGRRTCQLQGLEAKGGTQSFLTHSSHLRAHRQILAASHFCSTATPRPSTLHHYSLWYYLYATLFISYPRRRTLAVMHHVGAALHHDCA